MRPTEIFFDDDERRHRESDNHVWSSQTDEYGRPKKKRRKQEGSFW